MAIAVVYTSRMGQKPKQFDYSALAQRFSGREIWAFAHANNKQNLAVRPAFRIMFLIVFLPVAVFGLFMMFASLSLFLTRGELSDGFIPSVFMVGLAIWLWLIFRLSALRSLRYSKFAEANNITLLTGEAKFHPGLTFSLGHSRRFNPGFALPDKAQTNFGNYTWVTGSGKNSKTHHQGFVSINLSRKLPHVVLDAQKNNRFANLSNLPVGLKSRQQISLEGDFDKHFTVYCPSDYGRDTLYWLTPELMALLIDKFADYDVEVVDNYVYLYPNGAFDLDQTTIENIVNLAEWLYQEFEDNTHRYSDERVASFAANVVDKDGRRLKQRVSTGTIIGVIFFILWVVFNIWTALHR
jgi:hypothetical protein